MTTVINDFTTFDKAIKQALEKRITERGTELANVMMKEYEQKILSMFREMTASICLEIFRTISMERYGERLEIVITDLTKTKN